MYSETTPSKAIEPSRGAIRGPATARPLGHSDCHNTGAVTVEYHNKIHPLVADPHDCAENFSRLPALGNENACQRPKDPVRSTSSDSLLFFFSSPASSPNHYHQQGQYHHRWFTVSGLVAGISSLPPHCTLAPFCGAQPGHLRWRNFSSQLRRTFFVMSIRVGKNGTGIRYD